MTQNSVVAPPTPGSSTPSTTAYSQPIESTTPGTQTPHTNAESSKMATSNPALIHHGVSLSEYIFHVGYLGQNWTDIQLTFFDTGVALHRIILARSAYLHRLIHNTAPGQSIHLSFTDENITGSSVHIALQHLYKPCLHLVEPSNARAVLATSLLLEGMPELAHQAYVVARDSISPDTIIDYVGWLDRKGYNPVPTFGSINGNGVINGSGNGNGNGDTGSGDSIGELGWANHSRYGEYTGSLKRDTLDYLIHSLPSQIPTSNPQLTAIYSQLPYELFKLCVEHPSLPVGSMQDRFSFAKKVLAARKKLGVGVGPIEETVALGFKDGVSGVEVNKKAKKGRQFFKIEGN